MDAKAKLERFAEFKLKREEEKKCREERIKSRLDQIRTQKMKKVEINNQSLAPYFSTKTNLLSKVKLEGPPTKAPMAPKGIAKEEGPLKSNVSTKLLPKPLHIQHRRTIGAFAISRGISKAPDVNNRSSKVGALSKMMKTEIPVGTINNPKINNIVNNNISRNNKKLITKTGMTCNITTNNKNITALNRVKKHFDNNNNQSNKMNGNKINGRFSTYTRNKATEKKNNNNNDTELENNNNIIVHPNKTIIIGDSIDDKENDDKKKDGNKENAVGKDDTNKLVDKDTKDDNGNITKNKEIKIKKRISLSTEFLNPRKRLSKANHLPLKHNQTSHHKRNSCWTIDLAHSDMKEKMGNWLSRAQSTTTTTHRHLSCFNLHSPINMKAKSCMKANGGGWWNNAHIGGCNDEKNNIIHNNNNVNNNNTNNTNNNNFNNNSEDDNTKKGDGDNDDDNKNAMGDDIGNDDCIFGNEANSIGDGSGDNGEGRGDSVKGHGDIGEGYGDKGDGGIDDDMDTANEFNSVNVCDDKENENGHIGLSNHVYHTSHQDSSRHKRISLQVQATNAFRSTDVFYLCKEMEGMVLEKELVQARHPPSYQVTPVRRTTRRSCFASAKKPQDLIVESLDEIPVDSQRRSVFRPNKGLTIDHLVEFKSGLEFDEDGRSDNK